MPNFELFISGTPIPQGSKSAYVRNGRAVVADANKNLRKWRSTVATAMKIHADTHGWVKAPKDDEVIVSLIFFMPKPKSVKRENHTVKPDLDKLIRSICDSATDAGLWSDDSQVTFLVASKQYGDLAGTRVSITYGESTVDE